MHRTLASLSGGPLLAALIAGCPAPKDDTAAPDSGAVPDDTGDTGDTGTVPREPCDPEATFSGSIEGSQWSGTEVALSFYEPGEGAWSDGCYGGFIEDTLTLDGTTFDWAARVYASAGSDPRPVRATGCVTDTAMKLYIVEEDGTPWKGPWRLDRSSEEVEIVMCD